MQFMPPKPKEFESTVSNSWCRALVTTSSPFVTSSGSLKFSVGGITCSRKLIADSTASMAPLAAKPWPSEDLVLVNGIEAAPAPNTA